MKYWKWTGTASLAFLILTIAFYIPFLNDSIFTKRISEDRMEDYESLRAYLAGGELSSSFTEAERDHMRDVKELLATLNILAIISLIIFAASSYKIHNDKEKIKETLTNAGYASLGVLAVIGGIALIDFSFFWNNIFHPLLFPQGNWMFPADSTLITLFPQESFREFSYRFLAYSLVLSGALIVTGKKLTS